jgi:hypothetical protein
LIRRRECRRFAIELGRAARSLPAHGSLQDFQQLRHSRRSLTARQGSQHRVEHFLPLIVAGDALVELGAGGFAAI